MKKRMMCVAVAGILIGSLYTTTAHAKEEIVVPAEVAAISQELGKQYSISPELIQAICWRESRFQPDAESKGCVGIMQVYERYHKDRMERLGVTDLYDMRQNMLVAVDYLSELAQDMEVVEALSTYHGESNIAERIERGDVSRYVESILEVAAELERRNEEYGGWYLIPLGKEGRDGSVSDYVAGLHRVA